MEQLITIKEAAEIMKVGRTTINRWINEGKLKKVKIGTGTNGAVRLIRDEVETFIRNSIQNGDTDSKK
jgi:excisionase family DNA binding protein